MRVKLTVLEAPDIQKWVHFPMGSPHIDSGGNQLLESIRNIPGRDSPARLLIEDVESSIRNLKKYVPQEVNFEQLNTLAIKIGYMGPEEQVCFEGALALNSVTQMNEILRIADELDQYEMYLDVSSAEELGRYIVNHGLVDFSENVRPYLDYGRIGTEYDANHGGAFTGTSYITRRENAPVFDLDADRAQVCKVYLYTSKVGDTLPEPYCFVLPACKERLVQVKKAIGVDDFAQAQIVKVEYPPLSYLGEYLTVDCTSVELMNELAEEIESLAETDDEILKLCAVLEAEKPQTLADAVQIVRALDDYERIPCGRRPDDYGRYVLKHHRELDFNILEDLQGYIDETAYGKYRMEEDGVRETDCGLVRRISKPFPEQGAHMSKFPVQSQ